MLKGWRYWAFLAFCGWALWKAMDMAYALGRLSVHIEQAK